MEDFKKCNNGHFYKKDMSNCPYCPISDGTDAVDNSSGIDLNKTTLAGQMMPPNTSAKTEVFGASKNNDFQTPEKVFNSGNSPASKQPQRDINRTYIGGTTDQDSSAVSGSAASVDSVPRSSRRIVGWILSYTLDPMGVDYRIYEGNNSIGRESGNSISIKKDTTISAKHANILYKKGKFYIKDEMAANGTFLNGEELEIEKAFPLLDGDIIKIANTTFIFKASE